MALALLSKGEPAACRQIAPILPTFFLLTGCRTFVTFLPSSNRKERRMKFLAITLTMAGILIASGCRHDYNPTPPPYYCQPACGCAPACAPPSTPCAPSGTTYLTPTPMPRPIPNNGAPPAYAAPGATTYPAPGGNPYGTQGGNSYGTPGSNTSPSLPPR